jgi:urease accessory protein
MLLVTSILGRANEARFASRTVERILITSAEASKRRLRGRTDAGSDVAIDLPRGAYVEDGAVLLDDGERIVVAVRKPEEAAVIRFATSLEHAELVRQAALIGHAFGNQHVPIEVVDGEVRVPITTSQDIAAATFERLDLDGAAITFAAVAFGRTRPLTTHHSSHQHGADAHPDHEHPHE